VALEKKVDEFINHNTKEWLDKINSVNMPNEKERPVLEIQQRLDRLELVINWNMRLFDILKEKPNFERHGLKASISVTYKLNDLKIIQPYARSIQESLRTFHYTNSKITDKFVKLIAVTKNKAQASLLEGLQIEWKQGEYKLQKFAADIEKSVKNFEDAVYDAIEKS